MLVCIEWVKGLWDLHGVLLDTKLSPDAIKQTLLLMTEAQRDYHIRFTATFDIALPVLLGSFLAGISKLSFHNKAALYIPITAALFDLSEGAIQLLILSDFTNLYELKAVLTTIKFLLYALSLVIAIIAVIKRLARRNP